MLSSIHRRLRCVEVRLGRARLERVQLGLRGSEPILRILFALPGSFDVVTCAHTLEHIVNLDRAVSELKRVARRQVIVVVPCQRWYFYTLDEHVNFFPYAESLTSVIGLKDYSCRKIRGDWLYVGRMEPEVT